MRTRITLIAAEQVFIELAKSIEYTLIERFGFAKNEIKIHDLNEKNHKAVERFNKEDFELTFIIKAHRFFIPNFRGKKILFQTEELWNRRHKGNYFGLFANQYDRVLEMYDENCNLRGTQNVVYCPVGYSPVWERNLPEDEEDIDVLFHGGVTPRREKFYDELAKMGLNVVFTSINRPNTYGIERDKLIMRSKIDINIKAHDNWSYGPMHCLPAQANKSFMLTEKANGGYGPFKPGLHVAEYDGIEDCKKKVLYWLEHEKERKEFAIKAYNDMVKTCDFTDILANALGGYNSEKKLGPILSEE